MTTRIVSVALACDASDEKRLRAAGFAPVIRWVDTKARSDVGLKTIEALTLLDRRGPEPKIKAKKGSR